MFYYFFLLLNFTICNWKKVLFYRYNKTFSDIHKIQFEDIVMHFSFLILKSKFKIFIKTWSPIVLILSSSTNIPEDSYKKPLEDTNWLPMNLFLPKESLWGLVAKKMRKKEHRKKKHEANVNPISVLLVDILWPLSLYLVRSYRINWHEEVKYQGEMLRLMVPWEPEWWVWERERVCISPKIASCIKIQWRIENLENSLLNVKNLASYWKICERDLCEDDKKKNVKHEEDERALNNFHVKIT